MKKRILSLILALSMVLSVLPLGAFAEGSLPELVIGSDGYPVGSEGGSKDCNGGGNGNDWEYYSKSRILCLNGGTFDLSTTEPVKCEIHSFAIITGGTFNGAVYNLTETISGGIFNGTVTNDPTGKISGGTFQSTGSVTNYGTINGNGTFEGSVTNYSYIENGTFNGSVTNDGTNATIKNGTFNRDVANKAGGTISGGTFAGSVTNQGTITSGTFNGKVTNYLHRTISGGTFKGTVNNDYGTISGGTFAAGLSKNNGSKIRGGIFNGNANLTGAYHVTVTDGSVSQVNGEGPLNADGTPGTAWDLYSYKDTTMTITADTDIFSLNGKPIDESNYPNKNDKTTVTFTMPDKDVVLNGAITCTDLVMEKGWPEASNGGTTPCKGTGWEYIKKSSGSTNTGTLYLMSGSEPFDFNFADPATKITRTDAAVKCAIESYGTISGGIFDGTVTNNAGGEISDGTFKGDVENSGYIEKGTFNGEVTNNTSGTIFGGTFRGQVDNNGKITGGIFAAGLSTTPGTVTGGIFNGNTGLTGAHQVTVTNGSVSTVNDEGPRNADGTWDLYSYAGTTVTITADTEIFSLNGRLLGTDDHVNGNNKIVKFTMPDANVVLGTGELVMQNSYPVGSNNGTADCEGNGWSYDHSTDTLTLTSGTFDFSSTHPQKPSEETRPAPAVQCVIESYATITGGIFDRTVTNNAGGTISDGTFYGTVTNNGTITGNSIFKETVTNNAGGEISGGTFYGTVTNNGTITGNSIFKETVTNNAGGEISGGTFYGTVTNSGYIKDGTFNGKVTNRNTIENGTFAGSVTNEGTIKNGSFEKKVTNGRTIMDGVFKGVVENGGNGTIFGGTFAGRVNNSYGGHIFGGVFNGYIKVQGAGVYSITVDPASPNAKITEVNGVSAVWEPYVVVAELTKNQKVIITASTKIYSLNHKPLSTDNCNSAHDGNENTVKFTMPNANVVLNGAITSTDLVMEKGWPKDSDGGKTPARATAGSTSPMTRPMATCCF